MSRRAAAAAGLALAVAAASSHGCSPVGDRLSGRAARPLNLLLISIDTLRADHLGSYGYGAARTPRLDALAARGVRSGQRRAGVVGDGADERAYKEQNELSRHRMPPGPVRPRLVPFQLFSPRML